MNIPESEFMAVASPMTIHGAVIKTNEYIGELKNGIPHGHCKIIYTDGHIFEGKFVKGVRHGHGKYLWPDGE